jgi:hypothetical protein
MVNASLRIRSNGFCNGKVKSGGNYRGWIAVIDGILYGASMLTYFRIGLDDEATGLLLDLAAVVGKPPRELLAQLVRDILIEDRDCHTPSGRPVAVTGGERLH